MSDRELQLPSDEQRRRDRELIEAIGSHEPVGERYARTGEIPVQTDREPTMRPDPNTALTTDPTPVQLLLQPRRRIGRRIAQVAGLFVALGLAYLAVSFWQVWATGRSDEARPVDAIVVLGAAQYDGRPSPQLAARLDHVLDLWPEGLAPLVIVTGGNQPGDRFTEADVSAAYLTERGIPADAIKLEGDGTTTWESLRNVGAQVGETVESVLIVTDPYHALRCRLIAESVGFEASVSPTPTSVVSGSRQLQRELGEAVGVAVGRIIGFD
ncbi:MAG TPA: YdcF family protein, partial [Ilumatobacteraceae bacterium]|nr:YdcF family protein [Ilumatobacteraceae bacterium]